MEAESERPGHEGRKERKGKVIKGKMSGGVEASVSEEYEKTAEMMKYEHSFH